jgi:hypothetical protein
VGKHSVDNFNAVLGIGRGASPAERARVAAERPRAGAKPSKPSQPAETYSIRIAREGRQWCAVAAYTDVNHEEVEIARVRDLGRRAVVDRAYRAIRRHLMRR